jgi:hypothetical protein
LSRLAQTPGLGIFHQVRGQLLRFQTCDPMNP